MGLKQIREKAANLFGSRQWRCPSCERVFQVSQRKPDPLLCVDCRKREKAERRKDLLLAPFRFVGSTIKLTLVLVFGLIALVWVIGAATPGTSSPRSTGGGASGSFSDGGDSSRDAGGAVKVRGYQRSDGTVVRPHVRSAPKKE